MHFFIDPQALPTQLPADRYGAIDADTCRIASVFTLVQPSGAYAYAMLAGNIIVQPCATDSSLLNIVIKPVHAVHTRTNQIRYIVYRGIRKSSLFDGTDLKQKSTLPENHFLYRMWTQLEQWNQKHPETEADKVMPNEMGYDETIPTQTLIEHVFAGAVPDVFPTYVKEGMILGEFAAGAISIEVILAHDPVPSSVTDSRIDIGYLRKEEHLIDVTGLTGLERSAKQELLHRYVDMAALLGTAHNVGIYVPDEQTGTVDKYKGQSLYDSVISKFDTANTIYIDIRNDSGYSYNFYGKYGDTNGNDIQVVDAQQHVDTDVYGNDGWPILELDGKTVDYSDLSLRLRTDHNVRPVLYVQYVDIGDIYYKRFTDSTALLNEDTTPGWTKDITLHMPQVTQGGNTYSLAQYLALNYFEAAEQPVGGTQNRGISSLNEIDAYYNNAFCATQLVDLDETVFTQAVQTEATYVNGSLPDSDIHFSYAADAGVNWDSSKVVFFAHQIHTKERSNINNAVYENTGREGLGLEGSTNNNSFLNKELSIYKITVQEETDVDSYEEVEILAINHNGSANGGYEDVSFLGITRIEYQQLRATTGLNDHHLSYPYLEMVDGEAQTDKDGISYYRYRLGLVGVDNSNEWAVGFPTTDIDIYSSDGFGFASKNFAENTVINETELPFVRQLLEIRKAQLNQGYFIPINNFTKVITAERVFIAGKIFPFIQLVYTNVTGSDQKIYVTDMTLQTISPPLVDEMYGPKRINIANGKAYIYLPAEYPDLGYSYSQTLFDFLTNVQFSSEILRGEFPDYKTYELAFHKDKKTIDQLDGHDGVWLKQHREEKNSIWRNAMAAIVENEWQGVLAPFVQIADFYGYLDEEVKKKDHEVKWQRGAKKLVDVLAEDKTLFNIPLHMGGLEGGSIAIHDDVETILCELNLGICDYAITKFYALLYGGFADDPQQGEDAYQFDYVFIVSEQQVVAEPIYAKASPKTIAKFQDIVNKNLSGGQHGLGSWLFSKVTPAFNAFSRPAKVTDGVFRTDLPMLMLYLDTYIPYSECFKFADGTVDISYKDVIRNGDRLNGYKSYEIP